MSTVNALDSNVALEHSTYSSHFDKLVGDANVNRRFFDSALSRISFPALKRWISEQTDEHGHHKPLTGNGFEYLWRSREEALRWSKMTQVGLETAIFKFNTSHPEAPLPISTEILSANMERLSLELFNTSAALARMPYIPLTPRGSKLLVSPATAPTACQTEDKLQNLYLERLETGRNYNVLMNAIITFVDSSRDPNSNERLRNAVTSFDVNAITPISYLPSTAEWIDDLLAMKKSVDRSLIQYKYRSHDSPTGDCSSKCLTSGDWSRKVKPNGLDGPTMHCAEIIRTHDTLEKSLRNAILEAEERRDNWAAYAETYLGSDV